MADVSKAQKLASARKKFKELKKEKKKTAPQKTEENADSTPPSREHTPVESVTSPENAETAPLPNYFGHMSNSQPPAAFFDSFVQNPDPDTQSGIFPTNFFNNGSGNTPYEFKESVETQNITEDNKNEDVADFKAFDTVRLESHPQLSSIESLNQISDQLSTFINPKTDNPAAEIESQLEIRNQELAALLSQEKQKTEEMNSLLIEYQSRIAQLESTLKDQTLNRDLKIEQEVATLREQLQAHIQTVGILVGEKAELEANLSQYQISTKQKIEECEELQGRLRTSRSRVADLEREITLLRNEKSQNDNLGKEQSSELEILKQNHQQIKDERDELMQDLLEVREKLKTSSESGLVLQQQVAELSNQLSLANIKIQQLTIGGMDQVNGQVEQLTQEKFALEKQVADLNHTLKSISKEREESSLQYQQYAQQLNAQITSVATRLEKLQKENEALQMQEQNRVKHIGELEKQLQNLQTDQVNFVLQKDVSDNREEIEAALDLVEKLKSENSELQEKNIQVTNEKDMLFKDLGAKAESIRELEEMIDQLRHNQPDSAKLLATMESDKVAAARAVAQNAELKKQMESMQEVFLKVNEDKIELTEKLASEQHNSKELFEKLQKTELHLQTLADAIEIKDKELSHLRDNSMELKKEAINSEQLNDRLRHYEAQDHSTQALQNGLQESQQIIATLTDEIRILKQNSQKQNVTSNEESGDEVADLKQKLEKLQLRNRELESRANGESTTDSNHNDSWAVLDKEAAMKHLEAKFLKTMEDIANLTEEKQRLEHLVMQLQGETETIGEYVALYQYQRSLLKQKTIEKDQQLIQLANDREQMKKKLERLNQLVKQLVLEKGEVPAELLEHERANGDNLCEEHAKIHSEISAIKKNFNIEPINCDSQSTETAQEIIALLSEIKTSNLVQPTENFHHCPWCSGQLITV